MEHLSQMTVPPALLLTGSFCRGYVSVGVLSDGELVCTLSASAGGHPSLYVVTTELGVLPQLRWLNQVTILCMFLDNF